MDKAVRWLPPRKRFAIQDIRTPGDRVVWMPPSTLIGTEKEQMKKTSGGVSGDPTKATKEKREDFHNSVVCNIVKLVEDARAMDT